MNFVAVLTLGCEFCIAAEKYHIKCYANDDYMLNNLLLDCNSNVEQACYTKGEWTPPFMMPPERTESQL